MLKFLCAAPNDDLAKIKSLGFDGIRFNPPPPNTMWNLHGLVQHGLRGLWILKQPADLETFIRHRLPEGLRVDVEVVNEPNLSIEHPAWNPRDWAKFVTAVYRDSRLPDETLVVSGGISNLGKAQISYMREAMAAGMLADAFAFHRYKTEGRPIEALSGYASRSGEFEAFRSCLPAGARIWNSETGWHTQLQKSGHWPFAKKVQWKDADVATFARDEQAIEASNGVEVMTWYTWPDGPSENYEDHFGLKRTDGSLKPAALVWKGNA